MRKYKIVTSETGEVVIRVLKKGMFGMKIEEEIPITSGKKFLAAIAQPNVEIKKDGKNIVVLDKCNVELLKELEGVYQDDKCFYTLGRIMEIDAFQYYRAVFSVAELCGWELVMYLVYLRGDCYLIRAIEGNLDIKEEFMKIISGIMTSQYEEV